MRAYIKSTSAISPQQTFDKSDYLKERISQETPYLQAVEPVYKEYIKPALLRRMSRIIKMGVAAAKDALNQASVENPDAIIVGTGLGCIDDTEKFLKSIVDNAEGILSPTAFIQSTHNTIAGQIALLLHCSNYNFTYTNRGHSFENAVMDACMQLDEGKDNILVGAAEETTKVSYELLNKMTCVGDQTRGDAIVLGEGASFFVFSSEEDKDRPYLQGIKTMNNLREDEVLPASHDFLKKNDLSETDIDAVLIGRNDDQKDRYYDQLLNEFKQVPIVEFKRISGEHFTAPGFGLHLAVNMLENQKVYEHTTDSTDLKRPLKKILIYNHYKGVNYSFMLLAIE